MKATDIPRTIEECCQYLDLYLDDDLKQFFKTNTEEDSASASHHTLGRRIRNSWGFWTKDTILFHYLTALGLEHPDDMSGIILYFYWKHVNGQPWNDLDAEIKRYQNYWDNKSSFKK